MAKKCSICGKKLGVLNGKIDIHDGSVCVSCWSSAGLDFSSQAIYSATNRTVRQLISLIEREVIKGEAGNRAIKREPKFGDMLLGIVHKPVDIYLTTDDKFQVGFKCEGQPTINFNDLINGNEMIIGDGFIRNDSGEDLPEVRIICEFDPPIIDSGIIYYEEGTFKPGIDDRFEIEDPPVNLEEYAKIKTPTKGKISFTLFFGEQKIHTIDSVMEIEPAPEEEMKMLMHTILYEQEKNASGPVNVFLYARDNGTYKMDLLRKPELLYSMYSNGREQLIGDVYVVNDTYKALKKVQFEANFTSDILSPIKILLGDVPPGESITFEVDDPAIDVGKLEMLTEIEMCTATYKLSVNGKVVAESTGKITICPYNQWNAALILLPAYMTPNHPNVISVLQNASKWMLVYGLNPSLEGYQSEAKRVEEMIGGVYNAVKEANIIYSNPPASFFGPQRIRLCETVMEQKFATCMDMTILFASCLESFGLHPVLITAPGHIFAGVWLNEKGRLSEPVLSDAKLIQKYIEDGQLIAVECTAMNAGNDATYDKAKEIAYKTIKALADNNIENHECIDVQIVRAMGVRPLPMRKHNSVTQDTTIHQTTIETETADKEPVSKESTKITIKEPKVTEKSINGKYSKEEYKVFEADLSYITPDNFYDKKSKRLLKEAIAEIVSVEGPISQPALIKTLIGATSLGRVSKQMAEHLDKLVAGADVKITRQAGVRFLWEQGTDPAQYMTYRFKEQRSPDDISKYELKNAVCYLIQENGPMNKQDILKALIAMFGYSRSSKKLEDGGTLAIKVAKELKAVDTNDEGKFVLVE